MPWLDIGRHTFDFSAVVLVTRGIRAEGSEEAVTVSLASGKDVDLVGEDARLFREAFGEFAASRSVKGGAGPEGSPRIELSESLGGGTGSVGPSKMMG